MAQKPLGVLFSIKKPWRKYLFLARIAPKIDPSRKILTYSEGKLTRMLPKYPSLLFPYFLYLTRTGRKQEGLDLSESFQEAFNDEWEWQLAAAEVWFWLKRFQQGDLALSAAQRANPSGRDIYEYAAVIQRKRGNSFMELEALEALLLMEDRPSKRQNYLKKMALPLFQFRRYSEVVEALSGLNLGDQGWKLNYVMGVSLTEIGRPDAAEPYFLASARRLKVTESSIGAARARLHFRFKNLDSALLDFSEASVLSIEAIREWARAAAIVGKTVMAETAYQTLFDRDAVKPEDHYEYGSFLERNGQYAEAQVVYERGIPMASGKLMETLLYRTAICLGKVENYHDANEAFEKIFSTRAKRQKTGVLRSSSEIKDPGSLGSIHLLSASDGKEALVSGNQKAAFLKFCDVSEPRESFLDLSGWNKEFELTRFEYYLDQMENGPIMETTVLVESFLGRRVSCNPYAIVSRALGDNRFDDLEFILVADESESIPPMLQKHPRVSFVPRGSYGYMRFLARAKFLINNVTFPEFFVRRDEQRYLNTWHGIPWKHLGRDIQDGQYGHGNVVKNFLSATHLAMPDRHTADVLVNRQGLGGLLDTSRVLVTGSPRVDATLLKPSRQTLEALGVADNDLKVVLYAPTWREWSAQEADPGAEFRRVVNHLSSTLPEARVAVRAHHFLEASLVSVDSLDNVVVVPNTIDTNDLLAAVDVLVSDYSSIIFDFAATGRPIVKIIEDIDRYANERGLYFDPETVPGINCASPTEAALATKEALADPKPYGKTEFVEFEDGNATQRVIDFFFEDERGLPGLPSSEIGSVDETRVLLSVSGLNPNGITRSLQSLVVNLKRRGVSPYLLVYPEVLRNPAIQDTVADLGRNATIIPAYNNRYQNRTERSFSRYFFTGLGTTQLSSESILAASMHREFRRQFTDIQFDAVVEFDGYNPTRTLYCAFGPGSGTKVHVFHNEFKKEAESRFPRLRTAMRCVGAFDVIASVSEPVMIENDAFLAEFGLPSGRQIVLRNSLDIDFLSSSCQETVDEDISIWLDSGKDFKTAVVVGRLSPEKNHAALLHALFEQRASGQPLIRLLILGDGPLFLSLERLIESLNLSEFVFLAGFRKNPYPAILRSDAMLLPSLYEGQPIVLLEALALGSPVIATDIPGSRSVLGDLDGGVLVPCSKEGLAESIRIIASGALGAVQFDAAEYNGVVVDEFLRALRL